MLRMTSVSAKISINTTPPTLDIRNPKEPSLSLKTTHPKIKVEGTLAKVKIDQTQPFAESGLKKISALSADNAAYGMSKVKEGIARIASQGTELTNVHDNPEAIQSQAYHNAYDQFDGELVFVTMPQTRPTITVVEGNLDIQVEKGKVENNSRIQKVINNYKRGSVNISMERHQSLDIQV